MRSTLLVTMLLGISVLMAPFHAPAQAKATPQQLAQVSQGKWLQELDAGKYADSWMDAAQYFRSHVTKDRWVNGMKATHVPLGKMVSRKVVSSNFTKSIAGAPDGQYVVTKYNTDFEHKKGAVETVTAVFEMDGEWRVAAYYIQ